MDFWVRTKIQRISSKRLPRIEPPYVIPQFKRMDFKSKTLISVNDQDNKQSPQKRIDEQRNITDQLSGRIATHVFLVD